MHAYALLNSTSLTLLVQILLFQGVSLPVMGLSFMRMVLGRESWWMTQGSFLFFLTNTSLDAIDTLYIVKPYRNAFKMTKSFFGRK